MILRHPLSRLVALGIVGIACSVLIAEDLDAQRGGGRGRGRSRGGGVDLRPTRQKGPFVDLPWGAQSLLNKNVKTFRRLPPLLRAYLLKRLMDWDDFFKVDHLKYASFLEKAGNDDRDSLAAAFSESLRGVVGEPWPSGIAGRGRSGQGNRADQGGRQGQRGGRARPGERRVPGYRQRPMIRFEAQEMAAIGKALDRYVYADAELNPALIIIAVSGAQGDPAAIDPRDDGLASSGAVVNGVPFSGSARKWIATLLTGRDNPINDEKLSAPSLFECRNRPDKQRSKCSTIAIYPTRECPPSASKARGYGRKYGPLTVHAGDFELAAEKIREAVERARAAGHARDYIDEVVKPRLTPDDLRIGKVVKEKALARAVARALYASDESLDLSNAFLRDLALDCARRARPRMMLVHLVADERNAAYLNRLWSVVQEQADCVDRTTLCVLDQASGSALVVGPGVQAGASLPSGVTLQDLAATLAGRLGLEGFQSEGRPIPALAGI